MNYWIYRRDLFVWRNQYVQAKLIDPGPRELLQRYRDRGYRSPQQHSPYGFDVTFTYQINPRHPHPDNYVEGAGFNLFSHQLVEVMNAFEVHAEVFPARMVDKKGEWQQVLDYHVFHIMEGIVDALDAEASGWTGDWRQGVDQLVLAYGQFEERPVFMLDHLYLSLMRDDVKQEIQQRGLTGFRFIKPEWYKPKSDSFVPRHET